MSRATRGQRSIVISLPPGDELVVNNCVFRKGSWPRIEDTLLALRDAGIGLIDGLEFSERADGKLVIKGKRESA